MARGELALLEQRAEDENRVVSASHRFRHVETREARRTSLGLVRLRASLPRVRRRDCGITRKRLVDRLAQAHALRGSRSGEARRQQDCHELVHAVLGASFVAQQLGRWTPTARRMAIIGHQFVSPDWKRFRPTKAVNR